MQNANITDRFNQSNNVELIERINEQLETAGALGSVYSSIAWSYAGSFLNAKLGLYSEQDLDRIKRLEGRCEELAAIAGWANNLALPDYRPTVDELIERVGKTQAIVDEETLIAAKASVTGIDIETLKLALQLNEKQQAETAALHRKILEQHYAQIRKALSQALTAPMDSSFDLPLRDAVRIAERISEKAAAAKDRALMQVIRARTITQITRAAAEVKLIEAIIPQAEALYHRFSAEEQASVDRAPIEQLTAELTGTDEHEHSRWVQRQVV